MYYPIKTPTIIDVTKPPYCADNTGSVDCTKILCRIFDDILQREVDGIAALEKRLLNERKDLGEYCIGFESRRWATGYNVIFPEDVPDARIIYFPAGTYLVSDTVSYTLKKLQNIYLSKPYSELTRGIHLMGEDRDKTVIRLADHSSGFEKGSKKAVVSYTNASEACIRECSNVSQLNTFTDITVDCGKGNEGAIALRFVANNSGNVENVRLKADRGDIGLQLACSTEGVFRNIEIKGFDVGVYSNATSMCVFDTVDFSNIGLACFHSRRANGNVFRKISGDGAPVFRLEEGKGKQFYLDGDPLYEGDYKGNYLYHMQEGSVYRNGNRIECDDVGEPKKMPGIGVAITPDNYAFVDDYGAIGDGKTDSTAAIQAAVRSGKEVILFGSGHYLVNGKIYVPKSVKLIDFMFCDLYSGPQLISGELDSLFVICENSEAPLCFANLYTFEHFYGHFRFVCHAAKRDLLMKNVHTQTTAMYFNTVSGSRVYLDNCACTTGTYSLDTILSRHGYSPVFCHMIPFEFHGQEVLAYNLNPERADVEVLNDGSQLVICGLKVEGTGTSVNTVNGGRTFVYVSHAGIGNPKAENHQFCDDDTSRTTLFGGGVNKGFRCIFKNKNECCTTDGDAPTRFEIYKDMVHLI